MKKKEDMELVAHLQEVCSPMVSLYSKDGGLWLLTKSSVDKAYIMTKVSASEVIDYLDRKVRLRNLYTGKPYQIVVKNDDDEIMVESDSLVRKSTMVKSGKFDPDFCANPIIVKIYALRASAMGQ